MSLTELTGTHIYIIFAGGDTAMVHVGNVMWGPDRVRGDNLGGTSFDVQVLFYGLFMDEKLLKSKGLTVSTVGRGFVEGMSLRIGRRARLGPDVGGRAYGVIIELPADEAQRLYAEESVSDYIAETVAVQLFDGGANEAACYNLPKDNVVGANKEYVRYTIIFCRTVIATGTPAFTSSRYNPRIASTGAIISCAPWTNRVGGQSG